MRGLPFYVSKQILPFVKCEYKLSHYSHLYMASIDYVGLCLDSGLDFDETEHFVSGLENNQSGPLELERGCYDRLQRAIESLPSLGEPPQGYEKYPYLYYYLTIALLTPFYKCDHPRNDIISTLFCGSEGRALGRSVSTTAGFREWRAAATEEQIERMRQILKVNIAQEGYLSPICLTRRDWRKVPEDRHTLVNFMATQVGPFSHVGFHAPQGNPHELSTQRGYVYFGDVAKDMMKRASQEWDANAYQWGAHNILKILERPAA